MGQQAYDGATTRRRSAAAMLVVLACLLAGMTAVSEPAGAAATRVSKVTGVKAYTGVISDKLAITIGWRKASRATRYQVLVSPNANMSSPKKITTRSRKVTVKGLVLSRSYCIQVRGLRGRTVGKKSTKICTVASSKATWMTGQTLSADKSSTTLKVVWPRTAGATRYELDYALSSGGGLIDVQSAGSKRTLKGIKGSTATLQTALVPGLLPGRVYCFQVRGQAASGFGMRGPRHCKMTMKSTRGVPAKSVPLVFGTFNTCSNACDADDPTIGPWANRATAVRDRILDMRVGTTGQYADVVGIQEGRLATDSLEASLMGTFTLACKSVNELQSVFVRDSSAFQPDAASKGSIDFNTDFGDAAHGACWVRLEDADGNEVVVVNVHTNHLNSASADTLREQEIDALRSRMATDFPNIPIVYIGDFNSHRNRAVDGPARSLAKVGIDDGYDQAASYLSPPYQNSACPGACKTTRVPIESVTWGDHLDRVFAPPGWHVATWEIEARFSAGKYLLLSDHNPVLVSMLFPVN